MEDVKANPLRPVDAILEFEPHRSPQVAIIQPAALRAVLLAADSLRQGRFEQTVAILADFERLQPDTSCAIFMATAWSVRGGALLSLRRDAEAARALNRSVAYFALDPNAHRFLAEYHRLGGRWAESARELRTHLRYFPADADVQKQLGALQSRVPVAADRGIR